MNTSSLFFPYFQTRIDYYAHHEQEQERRQTIDFLTLITPTIGAPFQFFLWYFNGGFEYYFNQYWKNSPSVYPEGHGFSLKDDQWIFFVNSSVMAMDDWTDTISYNLEDDLQDLLETEFKKVCKIYTKRWHTTPNKFEFLETFRSDINFVEREMKINKTFIFPNKIIKETTLEWHQIFCSRLTEKIETISHKYFEPTELTEKTKELGKNNSDSPRKKSIKSRKKNDVFQITSIAAHKLYNLRITKEEENTSFINEEESSGYMEFQKILSNYDHSGCKFRFNCQPKYVAFIFKWIQIQKKFNNAFPALERMNCFKSKEGTPVNALNLNGALGEFKWKHEKFLKNRPLPTINELMPNADEEEILKYLCHQLSIIFLPSK